MPRFQRAQTKVPVRPARFQCRAVTDGRQGRVVVCGELELATAAQLDREFEQLQPYPERILLDLGAVEFIDSAGAHLLVELDRRVRRQGSRLTVAVDFWGDVEWFLAMTGTDRELTLTSAMCGGRGNGWRPGQGHRSADSYRSPVAADNHEPAVVALAE